MFMTVPVTRCWSLYSQNGGNEIYGEGLGDMIEAPVLLLLVPLTSSSMWQCEHNSPEDVGPHQTPVLGLRVYTLPGLCYLAIAVQTD